MTINFLFTVLFFVSGFLVFYTYVIFPLILSVLSGSKSLPQKTPSPEHKVSILIAAYNEEEVILKKLQSITTANFPADRMEVLVGSDASTDKTVELVREYSRRLPFIRLFEFAERRGKPAVVNNLVAESRNPVLILTDANVIFDKDLIGRLCSGFGDPAVGLVGANILNVGLKRDGISVQEKSYIERENLIKYREGLLWGTMMGPFGGCFAMRRELFENIPHGFLVDDFYVSMKVIEKNYKCINDLDAICYEDVSNDIRQEYKRKARISAGNFQNLVAFRKLLFRPFTPAGFCFFSHKFLRWMTPFLILVNLISLLIVSSSSKLFLYLFFIELILLFAPVYDRLLKKIGIHLKLVRFISYFSYMNLALLRGFFRYLKGIDSAVWTPTKRN